MGIYAFLFLVSGSVLIYYFGNIKFTIIYWQSFVWVTRCGGGGGDAWEDNKTKENTCIGDTVVWG